VQSFVGALRHRLVTPHVTIDGRVSKKGVVRKTAVDGRVTRHPGYGISLVCRKRIEEVFGWIKAQAGRAKAEAVFSFAVAAYNLIRIPKLLAAPTSGLATFGPPLQCPKTSRDRHRKSTPPTSKSQKPLKLPTFSAAC
jgi:hypothetical protein